MPPQIALILGAGKNVGEATAEKLMASGYKVALAARTPQASAPADTDKILQLQADFTLDGSVLEVFDAVRQKWGEPGVVVYNAYSSHPNARNDPLSLSLQDFDTDFAVNTRSTFVAAKEALRSFRTLPAGPKTFLYTGNLLNTGPTPGAALLGLGLGKSASAHLIAAADLAYTAEDIRFHYVDQREMDGTPMWQGVDGAAHAQFFADLIERKSEVPALATFVKDEGYKAFRDGSMTSQ